MMSILFQVEFTPLYGRNQSTGKKNLVGRLKSVSRPTCYWLSKTIFKISYRPFYAIVKPMLSSNDKLVKHRFRLGIR